MRTLSAGPFRCTTCDLVVDAIQDDWEQLVVLRSVRMFRFPNGEVHSFVSANLGRKKREQRLEKLAAKNAEEQ